MGRRTKPRANYRQDAIVMRRTIDAIEADNESSPDWKDKVTGHLHAAMALFLEHNPKGKAATNER